MAFLSVLTANKTLIIAALLIAMLAGAGVYIKVLKSDIKVLESEKVALNTKLAISNASITTLEGAINEQNTAIQKLKEHAIKREQEGRVWTAKAKVEADDLKKKADTLMKQIPSQGIPRCDAANKLFDLEIKNAK